MVNFISIIFFFILIIFFPDRLILDQGPSFTR